MLLKARANPYRRTPLFLWHSLPPRTPKPKNRSVGHVFFLSARALTFFLQVLEDTGDAASLNVDRVKKENARVSQRLRKKRAAMFASWCMMFAVRLRTPSLFILFFYVCLRSLLLLPLSLRLCRPFVGPSAGHRRNYTAQAQRDPSRVAPLIHFS